jgi:predicted ATP-grasp superfamily ATP-dependent carboligase
VRALIVESGHARAALAAVRGLHAAGWSVGVAVPGRDFATVSRSCTRSHRLPPLDAGIDAFAAAIEDAAARFGYEVVLPAGDAETLTVSVARDRLTPAVPLPAHASLLAAVDKLALTRAAARSGIATPATWEPGEPPPGEVAGPIMVKPRLHSEPGSGVLRRPAEPVADVEAARPAIARIEESGGAALLQEYVTGTLISWIGLIGPDGELLAAVQQEALRMHPPGNGVTSRGVTVPVSSELTEPALALLRSFSWVGLAQLQFIVPGDGRPRLVDLNARCYGSMALAIGAGVNFPALWAALGTGRPVERAEAVTGVGYQWLEGDIRTAWSRRGEGLGREARDLLRAAWRNEHSVWRLDDPVPGVVYTLQLASRAALRRRRDRAVPEAVTA